MLRDAPTSRSSRNEQNSSLPFVTSTIRPVIKRVDADQGNEYLKFKIRLLDKLSPVATLTLSYIPPSDLRRDLNSAIEPMNTNSVRVGGRMSRKHELHRFCIETLTRSGKERCAKFVLLTLSITVLSTAQTASAAYISVLFGTNSQNEGSWAQDAIDMDTALGRWDNWKVAASAGNTKIVNKDSTINDALTTLTNTATGANDFVLFLYSGHGGKYNNNVETAPALDVKDERLSTYKNATGWTRARDDMVANAFGGLNNDAFKLGIFSACYGGGMWGEPGLDLNKVPNSAMYASSSETQSTPLDDPFITALILSMFNKSADLNNDKKVTVLEWFTRAKALVKSTNPTFFYANTPTKDDIGSPPSDFYAEPVYYPYDSPYGDGRYNDFIVAYDVASPATLWIFLGGSISLLFSRRQLG